MTLAGLLATLQNFDEAIEYAEEAERVRPESNDPKALQLQLLIQKMALEQPDTEENMEIWADIEEGLSDLVCYLDLCQYNQTSNFLLAGNRCPLVLISVIVDGLIQIVNNVVIINKDIGA